MLAPYPLRCVLMTLLIAATCACDDGPTEPSAIGTPPALNLTGTWLGSIGVPGMSVSFEAAWTASQSGSAVTGPVALFRPSDKVAFSGTINGTLSGTRLALTYMVPRGSVPGAPDCTISGTGTIEATATLLSGLLNISSPNCEPISLLPSSVEQISLVKR